LNSYNHIFPDYWIDNMALNDIIDIEHKLDAGTLKITMIPSMLDQYNGDDTFNFVLTNNDGVWFHNYYMHDEFIDMSAILNEPDELIATLEEPPVIKQLDEHRYSLIFTVFGRKRTYPIYLELNQSSDDGCDLIEMRQDKLAMIKKIKHLENDLHSTNARIADLEEIITKYKSALISVASNS
jgi:hypothetical protein